MVSRRAEMGVGTLVIFIAMLLVAAVAAGVLLQTAGSLQQKALQTGQASESEISTHARVVEVSATNGATGNITNITMQVKLAPGSDPIKLNEMTVTLNTDNTTTTMTYSGSNSYNTTVNGSTVTAYFGVDYLINGTNHIDGNLARGDIIQLYMEAQSAIFEDEHVRINLIPKIGSATLVEFNTPDVISTQRVYLYP